MNVIKLGLVPDNRVQFTFQFQKHVPAAPGCYVLTTFDGHVLYVGLATDLQARFGQHRDNPQKCEPTAQGKAFWFYYLLVPELELNRVERTWMNAHLDAHGVLPILNKIYSPTR